MNKSGFKKSPEKLSPEKMSNKNYAQVWKGVSGLPNDLQFKINKMVINNYAVKMEGKTYYQDGNADGMDGRYMCYLSNTKYPDVNKKLLTQLRSIRGQIDLMKKNRRKYNKKAKNEINKIKKHNDYTEDSSNQSYTIISVSRDIDTEKVDKFMNMNNVYANLENELIETYDKILDTIKNIYLFPEIVRNINELLNLLDKDTPLKIAGGILTKENLNNDKNAIDDNTFEEIVDILKEETPKFIKLCLENPYHDELENRKYGKKCMDEIYTAVRKDGKVVII